MPVRMRRAKGNPVCSCCKEWEATHTIKLGEAVVDVCDGCAHKLLTKLIKAGKGEQ